MRGKFVLLLLVIAVEMSFGQGKRKGDHNELPEVVCYASGHSHQHFIPFDMENIARLKSANTNKAVFKVTYIGFSEDAKKAFQYAVDIWQTLLNSSVPIHVTANWEILGSGILGSCRPGDLYKNFNATEQIN